jgi:hypothetical protein
LEALLLFRIFRIENEVVHVHANIDFGSGRRRGRRCRVRGMGCSIERSSGDSGGFADNAGEQTQIVGGSRKVKIFKDR